MLSKLLGPVVAAIVACSSVALAGSYHLQPTPKDLNDLDHYYGYKWGIHTPWSDHDQIVSATLTLKNIRDWTQEPNELYIDLLPGAKHGVHSFWDDQASGDLFAGQGMSLVNYHNLPTTPQDLVYNFNALQRGALMLYALDGKFGLSFDPDCHFFNDGICLDVTTRPICVPLPAGVALWGPVAGLAACGMYLMRRRTVAAA